MFKIGDKVIDSFTNQIGTVSNISTEETETYPITVTFPDPINKYSTNSILQYTKRGFYNSESDFYTSKRIKNLSEIGDTVKVGPTHIYISFSHSIFLLPLALTSFKVVNDIIIATYNDQVYTIYTENIDRVIEQILNPTKKESL